MADILIAENLRQQIMNERNFFRYFRKIFSLVSMELITPVVIQPLLVLFITFSIPNNIPLISITVGISLFISIQLAKHDLRSHVLYYWIVLSITYTIIVFELIVVSLSEIEPTENFFLVIFTVVSVFFLYLTTTRNDKFSVSGGILENGNGSLFVNGNGNYIMNGNGCSSICPVCRVKMNPRNYHCHICQKCVPKYDHHSYWLNCCIGEVNLHYYVAGIFFGILALTYASLLILTTICSPEFQLGILLPEDCTNIGDNIEMCTCLVCGIYCMELAIVLFFKMIHHLWLISRGLSSFEWKEQFRYNWGGSRPYSYGFCKNWVLFFKKFRKIQIC